MIGFSLLLPVLRPEMVERWRSSICVRFSSIVAVIRKRCTTVGRDWPIRWTRPMACSSLPGLRIGSTSKTCVASIRLSPLAPEWTGRRRHVISGSFLNRERFWWLLCESKMQCCNPFSFSARLRITKTSIHWNVDTVILPLGYRINNIVTMRNNFPCKMGGGGGWEIFAKPFVF